MKTAHHSSASAMVDARRTRRWRAVTARATAPVLERLEGRQLFSGVPTATITGPATVPEGSNYALALSTANRTTPVDHWTVNWGDGQQSTASGTAIEADHVYADGPNAYTISATATLANGVILTANVVGAGVTNPGQLDPAFATAGELVSGTTYSTSEGVAALDNGQFVVAESVGSGTSATQVLQRFNPNGTLDTTFGTNGTLTVAGATSIVSVLDEHIADPNHPGYQVERLLVVGNENSLNGYTCHPYLWRYNIGESAYGLPDGTPDAAFGNRGVVSLPGVLPSAPYEGDNAAAVTIAPSGQIVVAGVAWRGSGFEQSGQWLTVSRLNPDGSLDTTFDSTGQQYAAIGGYNSPAVTAPLQVVGVVAAADGSVVAMTAGGGLAKMTNAGQLDATFGTAGIATEAPYASPRSVYYQTLTLDAAGNLLLGGQLRFGSSYGWAIGRYSYSTGAIVATFGANDANDTSGFAGVEGRLTSGDSADGITGLTTLANGQVVSLGQQTSTWNGTAWEMAVGRFNTDGTPDTSFATTGITLVDFGGTAIAAAGLSVQPDGKLLAAETYTVASPSYLSKFGIARLGQTVAGTVTPVPVSVSNVPPTPTITAPPTSGLEGTTISLSGSATDPSPVDTAAGLALAWSVSNRNGAIYASGTGNTFTFTPNDNGTYVVTLTATDKDGGVGTTTDTIAVANVSPTPTIAAPVTTGLEGTAISLSGSATDPSTVDTAAGLPLAWSVTDNGVPYASGTGASITFTPNDNGSYVVMLTATDKDGGVGTTTDAIAVANVPPTPTIAAPVTTGLEGTSVSLSGSATDPSTVDTAAGLTLGWSVTKNGSAYATGSGASETFTPNDNGTYVVTLSATDKDGGVGTTTDIIAVANVPPTPTIAAPVTPGLEGTSITLSGSATDPSTVDTAAGLTLGWSVTKNGAAYATGSGASYTFTPNDNGSYVVTLSATDKDGGVGTTTDTIAVANVPPTPVMAAPPSAGSEGTPITLSGSATDPSSADTAAGLSLAWLVTDNGVTYASGTGGSFTFTPADNGAYVVTLSATDKDGGVGTTTDIIAVANVPPTPTVTAPVTTGLEGTAITLAGSATDPSTVDTAAGLTLGWSVTKNGSAYATGSGASETFTPNDNGTYVVTLSATDKDGGVGTTTDTIAVANVPPTPTITGPVTTGLEGTAISLSGSATDPSPVDAAAGLTLGWAVTKNGSPFASGSGGAITVTPNDNGTYVATLSATDKDGGVGTTTDTIAVANVPPTPTITTPVTTGLEGTAITLGGSATDPSTVDTAAGLTLGWSVTKNGAAYATGAGASYTFTPNDNGTYVVTLSATDKDGGVGTTTDAITVLNVAPTAAIASPLTTSPEGTAITLTGSATDPSSADTAAGLTRAWSVTKNGSPFATGSGGTLTFTPDDNGTFVATFTVTDKDGGVSTATDAITVTNVAPTPAIAAPVTTGYAGVAVSLSGSATDPSTADTAAGLTLAWSVTKNGAAFGTAGSAASYSFTPATTGTYVVTLTATDKDGAVGTTTDTVTVIPAGYRLSGSTLMYDGTAEATSVASYAQRADGAAYYLTTGKTFGVNQYATGTNAVLGLVYSYGMRSDGYAYYWSQADSKLYLNLPSENIPVDTNAISGFGMRSDGYAYFWETASKNLYLNTPGFTVAVDNNPVLGFGVRSDGSAYFWDSVTKILQLNTPAANYQIGSGPVQGFGMRADGSGYFWDATTGNLFVNIATGAPAGTSVQLGSTAVSAFTTDSDGNGYYVPVGTTTLRKNTTSTDTLVTATYVPGTLKNAGPGPVSAVSYSMVNSGVTTPVTIPL